MTVGVPKIHPRISRCVSELSPENSPAPSPPPASPDLCEESHNISKKPLGGRKRSRVDSGPRPVTDVKEKRHGPLRRFVSQEEFLSCGMDENYSSNSSCLANRIEDFEGLSAAPTGRGSDEDAVGSAAVQNNPKRPSGSPMRCVSEFDDVADTKKVLPKRVSEVVDSVDSSSGEAIKADEAKENRRQDTLEPPAPHLPNPLQHPNVLATHTRALRIEAELFPLRLILGRLMSNLSYNRRQVFNTPVDPVALGIPDYFTIVTNPMDLGTVKARLHAVAYSCREDVANDIRLVFNNAMAYNPRDNSVHHAARCLLAEFEKAYGAVSPKSAVHPSQSATLNESAPTNIRPPVSSAIPSSSEVKSVPQGLKRVVSSNALIPDASNSTSPPLHQAEHPLAAVDASKDVGDTRSPVSRHTQRRAHRHPSGYRHIDAEKELKRARAARRRASVPHSCQSCLGRTCALCFQGCLHHEPTLLLCAGANCNGAKIRKGAAYYIANDGSCQFCQRCYSNLASVLPTTNDHVKSRGTVRYKRDLLKRKNDEEIVEAWVTCIKCGGGFHQICAMHNRLVHDEDNYLCPSCTSSTMQLPQKGVGKRNRPGSGISQCERYTFVCGSDVPVKLDEVLPRNFRVGEHFLSADTLAHTAISSFMERKVQEKMVSEDCPNAEHTVVVRVISDCNKYFKVPDVVKRHFRMEVSSSDENGSAVSPPSAVKYKSKAFALFQKIDGLDVCVFCMYVQEYDGDYEYDAEVDQSNLVDQKRVYIAYLDSVEHFRPRPCRTQVYHEMLVAYLASARARGYESAHIWACPPTRGNSFVFWNHPASQRTPTRERLVSWYHGALSRAADCGVVCDVKSLYECSFEKFVRGVSQTNPTGTLHGKMVCPPLFDGDFWIEEAVRIHTASMARNLRSNSVVKTSSTSSIVANKICPSQLESSCPAMMVASVIQDRIMAHPSSKPFRRPVNAAALKLNDYHSVISEPMDLGTVYSRCLLGEFKTLGDLVADVELVFANALRYNPKGHYVHRMAVEMRDLFFKELDFLTSCWARSESGVVDRKSFSDLSMSLDVRLRCVETQSPPIRFPAEAMASDEGEILKTEDSRNMQSHPIRDSLCSEQTVSQGQVDSLTAGPDAIMQRMVGGDVWLMDKRNPVPPKSTKKACGKRKSVAAAGDEEHPKRRRQSWLGEEVGESVRRLRTCFFTCSLTPKRSMTAEEQQKVNDYESYVSCFEQAKGNNGTVPSRLADTRHALLEVSQYRNFEFDTLRRAKYSTAMLLYHLQNDAPGLVPTCTSCEETITEVRWHKVKNKTERRQWGRGPGRNAKGVAWSAAYPTVGGKWRAEELCSDCHSKSSNQDSFIPIQVSIQT